MDGIIDINSTLPWLVKGSNGSLLLCFELNNFLLKRCILRTQALVFFLVSSREVLQCHAAFHLSLLVDLYACLEFCELRLFSLSESSLGGPVYIVSGFFRRIIHKRGNSFSVNGYLPVVVFTSTLVAL